MCGDASGRCFTLAHYVLAPRLRRDMNRGAAGMVPAHGQARAPRWLGRRPALRGLVERSRRGVSRSCLPSHSWAAWPTFLTGHDPGWHGDFDILEYRPGAMRRIPVSSRSILAPIWPDRLSEAGKTVLLLNVPLTYPPPALRGVVIAGGVVPPRTTYSYPPDVGSRLGWPINGGSWTTFRHRPDDFVADLEALTRPPRSRHAHSSRRGGLGRRLHGVRLHRPPATLSARICPPGASRVSRGLRLTGRRPGPGSLPPARPRACLAARAHRRRRPRHLHVRSRTPSCTRAVSMNKVLEPGTPCSELRAGPSGWSRRCRDRRRVRPQAPASGTVPPSRAIHVDSSRPRSLDPSSTMSRSTASKPSTARGSAARVAGKNSSSLKHGIWMISFIGESGPAAVARV
jgi:hypothetical protein